LALWLHIVASDEYSIEMVDQKFMVIGHSYLSNDRDFGSIESAKLKSQYIYIPQHWVALIEREHTKIPFSVQK